MKTLLITMISCFRAGFMFAQEPIDVTDQTIKISGLKEEELYFGFAEGDQVIFNFTEISSKELKEVEIVEYPGNSRFSDYKTSSIQGKIFTVAHKAILVFRFKNSAISGRICKIRIQRIPVSETTRNFNCMVVWKTRQDTSWNTYTRDVVIGYDTTYEQKKKRELVKTDTLITPLFDKTIRVHSETAIGKTQYETVPVQLPTNTYYPSSIYPYKSTELIAWSYWMGVGQVAAEDYEKANKALSNGIKVLGALTGYAALATLASTGISMFSHTNLGDNVRFRFYGLQNGQTLTIDQGNITSASGRNEKIRQGSFSIELFNDNFRDGIDVHVKMIALQVSKTWEDLPYTVLKINARKEKQLFRDPVITTYQVPVTGL